MPSNNSRAGTSHQLSWTPVSSNCLPGDNEKTLDFVTYAASLWSCWSVQRIFGRTQQTTNPAPVIRYWNSLFPPLLFYTNQGIPVIYNSWIDTSKVAVTRKTSLLKLDYEKEHRVRVSNDMCSKWWVSRCWYKYGALKWVLKKYNTLVRVPLSRGCFTDADAMLRLPVLPDCSLISGRLALPVYATCLFHSTLVCFPCNHRA